MLHFLVQMSYLAQMFLGEKGNDSSKETLYLYANKPMGGGKV
jgi:hypothetical protein